MVRVVKAILISCVVSQNKKKSKVNRTAKGKIELLNRIIEMSNRLRILLGVFVVFVIGAGLVFYFYFPKTNYLIPGVPYYGIYNHFFNADSLAVTSVADVLGYWGDKRFSLQDLTGRFSASVNEGNEDNATTTTFNSTLNIQKFFQDNGYETFRWASNEPGGEIGQIKKFVNSKQKIPVIVYQKRSENPQRLSRGFRVVIGIFDRGKKIISHDHDFGNNYEISYEDFEKMFSDNSRAVLAVWPSKELLSRIDGPNYSLQYPARLAIMDELGELMIKGADALNFYKQEDYEKAFHLQQEFVSDQKFNDFSPALRVRFYSFLAHLNILLGDYDGAIELIINKILPINENLSQPYGEWTEQIDYFKKNENRTEDKSGTPYSLLAKAYYFKGDQEQALENLEIALRINPLVEGFRQTYEKLKKELNK